MIRRISCILLGLLLLTSAVSAQDSSTPSPTPQFYTVAPGDTLNLIAQRFHTTPLELMRENDISNGDLVFVGTVLRIPSGSSDDSVVETPLAPNSTPELAATSEASPTETPTPATRSSSLGFEIGGEVFGFKHVELMHQTGMTWAKVSLRWTPDDTLDSAQNAINQAHSNDLKILLEVSGDPQLLRADPAGYTKQYVTYLGKVSALAPDAIEVWSGMNADSIRAADYSTILQAAFLSIKQANLQVLVVSGALARATTLGAQCTSSGCGDQPYLQALADANIAQSADCIGLRYTLGAIPPNIVSGDSRGSEFVYYYPTTVSTYAGIFPNKPLCFTEFGYLVTGRVPLANSRFAWAQTTTAAQRATWLARAIVLASQSDRIRLLIVYNIDATVSTPDNPQGYYAIIGTNNACLACQTISTVFQPQ